MSENFTGGCLCGAVRYEARGEPMVTGLCQCDDCRRSSGAGHCAHIGMGADRVDVEGAVTSYEKAADSGNMVTRAFCPTCGGPVYSTNSGMPEMIFLRASSLDDLEIFRPQMAVYTKRAASWDTLDPNLPSFEEMPPTMPV